VSRWVFLLPNAYRIFMPIEAIGKHAKCDPEWPDCERGDTFQVPRTAVWSDCWPDGCCGEEGPERLEAAARLNTQFVFGEVGRVLGAVVIGRVSIDLGLKALNIKLQERGNRNASDGGS
jgi:hypothetical protein